MADTFTLWAEIKSYARDYAASDRPLPWDKECQLWLKAHVFRGLNGDPGRHEAFEFYAQEIKNLIRSIREHRAPAP